MIGVINQPLRLLCIFVFLFGIKARQVQINGNITDNVGSNSTTLACNFTINTGNILNSVRILTKNITLPEFEIVASFSTDYGPKLEPFGKVLFGNASLSPVNRDSERVSMSFDDLKCKHSRLYKCELFYITPENPNIITESEVMGISLQVSPSKPDKICLVLTSVESPVPTTKPVNYSYSSPSLSVNTNENEMLSASETEKQNTSSPFNRFTIQTPGSKTTSSFSQEDISTKSSKRTTKYYIPQTTTLQGIAEGDNITVVCTGEVGNPPMKHFFLKYLNGKIGHMHETFPATSTSILEISENCSYYRTSNLTFQVTAKDNSAVIRCVVDSPMAEPDTLYLEMEPIEVYWDKSKSSTSGSTRVPYSSDGNKTADLDIKTIIGIGVAVVVVVVIGVLIWKTESCVCRKEKKEEYKPVDRMESNMDQIESQETTQTVPSTSSTKKTTGYEDIDLDDTGMKFKLLSDEETIAKVKQHNEEYLKKLKEDEEREKDNPTQPPQAAVYACVNKPKSTVTTENKPPAGQEEEDVYEESKEGLYDTSGDRRHKENITVENYDSTEKFKNEESDYNDLFSEQNSKIGANINKSYGNSEHKEEKRQVATVSPTVRMSSSSQGDGQKRKSDEIQPKTEKLTTQETFL